MNSIKIKIILYKILLFILFFALISLVIEIAFFNKNYFYNKINSSNGQPSFDYYWVRHLAVFLILDLAFLIQRKKINLRNLKPYSAVFLMFINIIPGIAFLSKYLFLFLSFILFLYIKSNFNFWEYKHLLYKNLYIIVFFIVLFILFFPLLFKEGYVYNPLLLFTKLPGYRLSNVSHISGLRETAGGASDLFDAFLPQWEYTYRTLREGNFPLWRFNKGLGEPHHRNYHPEELISFIIDPSQALTLRVLLKLFLSMVGMFFLLRALKIHNMLSIIGGIAYSLSGFIVGWLHGPQSSVCYHIPFLFFFMIKYLRSKETKFLFYFALWSSLTIYAGFIAIAGYSFYGVGLFLILFYLFDKHRLFQKIKELFKISLYWMLGIITVSFHFIPLYYTFFISKNIDITYRKIGQVSFLSPKYFINIFFPFYYGWKITPEIRPYVSSILLLFLILGVVFLILKLMKFERKFIDKEKYYILFLLLLIPFMMAMFGIFPFYQLSCNLPILNSSPLHRLQSMTCFILIILGVKGGELFIQSYHKFLEVYKKRKWLFLTVTGSLWLICVLVAVSSILSDGDEKYSTIYPVFILLSSVILAFQLLVFLKKKYIFFLVTLLILVSVETIVQNRRYLSVSKEQYFITKIKVPLIDFVKIHSERYDGVLVFDSNYNINGTLGNYDLREKIVHKFYEVDYKKLIIDTFSAKSFKSPTAPALESKFTDFNSSFIQLLGVKYLIFRHEFEGNSLPPYYRMVYNSLDGKVYENILYQKTKGIFFCKPKYFEPHNKNEVIRYIKSMDYSRYVYIDSEKKIDLNYKDNMSCYIDIVRYTPNEVVYKYKAKSDGILTFPEAYDKSWSVIVNRKKTEVLRTNLIFRGVAIRKGKGLIIFRYHIPKDFKIFGLIGLISLLSLLAIYIFSVHKKTCLFSS